MLMLELARTEQMVRSNRFTTRDNPWDPVEINSASVFGTHVAEPILASGQTPRKQAGHMIASDPIKTLYLNLQAGGRPHMGPG